MAYPMESTSEHLAIAEQQHCTSNMIKFTAFDSCLGIVARKGKLLTAAHLVLHSKTGSAIGAQDAPEVASVFDQAPYDEIDIVGEVSGWCQGTFLPAFIGYRKNWFADDDQEFSYDTDTRGIIGARISNLGKIVLYKQK